jgi:phosphoribulokinase
MVEERLWKQLGMTGPLPSALGRIGPSERSTPLAVAQLILLHHLLNA